MLVAGIASVVLVASVASVALITGIMGIMGIMRVDPWAANDVFFESILGKLPRAYYVRCLGPPDPLHDFAFKISSGPSTRHFDWGNVPSPRSPPPPRCVAT